MYEEKKFSKSFFCTVEVIVLKIVVFEMAKGAKIRGGSCLEIKCNVVFIVVPETNAMNANRNVNENLALWIHKFGVWGYGLEG